MKTATNTMDARSARFPIFAGHRVDGRKQTNARDVRRSGWAASGRTERTTTAPASKATKAALPKNDPDLRALLHAKHKAKIETHEKNSLFRDIVADGRYGKADLNRVWKAVEQDAAQKKKDADIASGKFFPDVNTGDFCDLCDYAQMRIAAQNEKAPFLFQFSNELARVSLNGDGVARIETLNLGRFKNALNSVSKWQVTTMSGNDPMTKLVPAPKDVAEHLFNGSYNALPSLRRLVTVPTYTTGKILASEGYFEGLYYHPRSNLTIARPDAAPTLDQVKEAVTELADIFADFSLDGMNRAEFTAAVEAGKDVPSFTHLLSYGLTSIAREMIIGHVPGHLARKDQPRSGATLAMTTMEQIATTYPASPQIMPLREEELGKVLLSEFLAGPPYILFDNLPEGTQIESDALATAITSYPHYKGRVLGNSQMKSVPANAVIGFTGNRTALSTQLAERMLLISVAPQIENPGLRSTDSFKYSLPDHIAINAARYFGYMLVLVQNWIAKGGPEWMGVPLGGFQAHASTIGGILEAAGIKGFMGNRDKLAALIKVDDPANSFMDALIAVHDETGGKAVFRAGDADAKRAPELKGRPIFSFADILTDAQIKMDNWGYRYDEDSLFYPKAANNIISQKISTMVDTIRGDYKLTLMNVGTEKYGNYYCLERLPEQAQAAAPESEQKPKRRQRRTTKF